MRWEKVKQMCIWSHEVNPPFPCNCASCCSKEVDQVVTELYRVSYVAYSLSQQTANMHENSSAESEITGENLRKLNIPHSPSPTPPHRICHFIPWNSGVLLTCHLVFNVHIYLSVFPIGLLPHWRIGRFWFFFFTSVFLRISFSSRHS